MRYAHTGPASGRRSTPHVEPIGFTARNHGRIRATVRQTVRTLNGAVLTEGVVLHTYVFRGGLIAGMDIGEPGP